MMFNCRSCLRHALRAVIDESRHRLTDAAPKAQSTRFARSFASSVHKPARVLAVTRTKDDSKPRKPYQRSSHAKESILTQDQSDLFLDLIRKPTDQQSRSAQSSAIRELQWHKDRFKLADYVRARLKDAGTERFLNTLALVRLASTSLGSCTVSWNHLIDYLVSQRAPRAAIKIYNEVGFHHFKPAYSWS